MTIDALAPLYPWTKALHLIAVIAWMAALLYLPRLYVYHSQVPVGGPESALLGSPTLGRPGAVGAPWSEVT